MFRLSKLHRSVGLMVTTAALAFGVNADDSEQAFKLPERSSMITIPNASTPYRLRYMTDCNTSPSTCLIETTSLFTAWMDSGVPYDYTTWLPEAKLQTSDFQQNRDYEQDQIRFEQQRFRHKETGELVNNGDPVLHEQTITRTEYRPVSVSYTGWVNNGANHSCDDWSPETDTVKWGEEFTQYRGCLEPQMQYRVYTAEGAEIARETELQNVGDQENQLALGTLDYITQTIMGTPEDWSDFGDKTCTTWTPDTDTVWEDTEFTQNRDCDIAQERNVTYWDQWASGAEDTENRTERETQTREWEDSQVVIGTKTLWMATSDDFSIWTNDGPYSATTWAPSPNSQTANYTQSRTKTQPQTRDKYTREKNQRDGTYRTIETTAEERNVVTPEQRTVAVSQSEWANTSVSSQTAWSPAVSNQTANFTQSRGYTQNQKSTRSHKVDGTTIFSKELTRSLANQSESRTVTAANGNWGDYGNAYDYGNWSVNYGNQTSNYTRNRPYKKDKYRTWTYKADGETLGTWSQKNTGNFTQTENVVVTLSGWTDTTASSQTAWSPAVSNQTANFTQTRGFTQNQKATRYHKVDGKTVHTNALTRSLANQSESRTVTATYGNWGSYGSAYGYGGWNTSYGNQTSNYTRSRSYKKDRYRTWTYKAGGSTLGTWSQKNTGSFTQTENVSVSWSGWSNSGGLIECSSTWSPSLSNYWNDELVSQTRSCKQKQVGTYTHKVNSTTVHTRSVDRKVAATESRRTQYGTKTRYTVASQSTCDASTVYDTTYGSWSPVADAQTSSYTQSQKKTQKRRQWCYNVKTDNKTGSKSQVNGYWKYNSDVVSYPQRTVTVSKGSWAWVDGTQDSYSSWSPSSSSKSGTTSNYSQTRTYKQDQRQKYTHSVGGTNIRSFYVYKRDVSRTTSPRTVTVKQTTGWTNNGSIHSCGSWSTYSSTQDRRACKQPQYRKLTHYVGTTKYGGPFTFTRNKTVYQYRDSVTYKWVHVAEAYGEREEPQTYVTKGSTCTKSQEGLYNAYHAQYESNGREEGWTVKYARCTKQ